MSFGKSKVLAIEHEHSKACRANNCPLPGTIARDGSRFLCAVHDEALPENWFSVTQKMKENDYLIYAIQQVLKASDFAWWSTEWKIFDAYFEAQPLLKPSQEERKRKAWYEYRLRETLMSRCGLMSKEPQPRGAPSEIKHKSNPVFDNLAQEVHR